ncbi:hypothetical protein [Desulfosarcina cetonica]|uniref:hypothetical protein n=1 Tax=Desulfosarcina cetonica TaxID=90730 RepID=UPI0006D2116C|nr:hypothetical protein [Desulfosarcina cetonica]
MDSTNANKWPIVLFFLTSGLFFLGCVWYLWAGSLPPAPYRGTSPDARPSAATIQLTKNRAAEIDGNRIVYRGRHDGDLQLDLFILELDPHYAYPLHIPEKSAREGFFIGSRYFRLLAASSGKISLQPQ